MARVFRGATALLAVTFLTMLAMPTHAQAGFAGCGNGSIEFGEGCDDGGSQSNDGCSFECLVELTYPCNTSGPGLTGDASCESGICDEGSNTCAAVNQCGNTVCEIANDETCATCPADCGACTTTTSTTLPTTTTTLVVETTTTTSTLPVETTTTTLTVETTTTTLPVETTTTTLPVETTTTTMVVETTTTTLPATGACCSNLGCTDNTAQDYCTGELQGSWAGEDTTCQAGACSECGNGCLEPGEECDDADTFSGDGCDSGCKEEQCWQCGILQGGFSTSTTFPDIPGCQPSTCFRERDCGICGNGEIEFGEQCDDGNTTSGAGDCCSASCQYVSGGTSCADSTFCDGPETCDGSGSCVSGTPPTCSNMNSACTVGTCDPKLDACVADPAPKEGDECAASGACVAADSGTCQNGLCVGAGTMLSPSCRWIICAGSPDGDVRVRTGRGSSLNANTCGDTSKWAGTTTASMVSVLPMGEGVRFYGPPVVDGDIVTGGSTVKSNLYLDIPGTTTKFIDTLVTMAKDPSGFVDTTGNHPLVDVCSDDQDILAAAVPLLEGLGNPAVEEGPEGKGLKVAVGGSYPIDKTGLGISIVDMDGLKVGHGATLTLTGNANDVIVLRVHGRLKFGYHASLVLAGGLVPEHVLIYSDNSRCRVSPGVTGAGTVFCPEAGRFKIGVGAKWTGTFLGGAREVQVRLGAVLTHAAFTGF